jgi:hypothetical protein
MIIGITGKARSGKDTFAEFLAEEIYKKIKQRFVLMAYAHELKLRVQKDFDLRYEQLWGDQKEVADKRYFKPFKADFINNEIGEVTSGNWTPREILQAYGQFFRTINGNFWVEHLFRTIDEKEYKNVMITDVRHPNEADPIIDREGYIIKVVAHRQEQEKVHGKGHISETAMDSYDKIDFTVDNIAGLDELRHTAKDVANFLIEAERLKNKQRRRNKNA